MEIISTRDKKRRNKPQVDLTTMVYGKIPPQAKELEEAVLGAIMLEKSAFDTLIDTNLKPECFYVEAHQLIFKAMQSMQQRGVPIDILTVVEELKRLEQLEIVGGAYFVSKLTNMVVSTANIDAHARIILQKFIQRELIKISGEIIGEAYEDSTDVFDLLDESETKMFNITNNYLKKNFEDIGSVLAKTINRIDDLRNQKDDISGVPSGFVSLDRITYGWQPTDLIILAARPSVGKTAFALNLARNAALGPKPTGVGFFSLEMGASQLVQRILSAESEIHMEKISRGKLEDYEYQQLHTKGIKKLETAPLYIDDTAALNIFEFRAKARRLVNKHNVGIIIIDYLQLMSGNNDKGSNREQEISTISRNLKALAKELNIPIIALSQLSRAVETRKESNKMPQLSDLRESGAIEQDADMVMFIYRPEYYEVNANENGESTKGETHIRIAKHRNGALDTVKLKALLHIQKFEEWDDNNISGMLGGNFKPVGPSPLGTPGQESGGGKFFVQSSKMNTNSFDEGFDVDPVW